MGYVLGALVAATLIVYTAVMVVSADSEQTRHLPKIVWLLVVILIPGLGAICWWLFGHPIAHEVPPVAPDDDPDFLRRLKPGPPR